MPFVPQAAVRPPRPSRARNAHHISAELVAARAGVSYRTVYRHFADMEALFAGMADRLAREYEAWQAPFAAAGWRDQLDEMIARRASTFERLLPYKRAADAHRHRSNVIQERHEKLLSRMRERLIRATITRALDDQASPRAG